MPFSAPEETPAEAPAPPPAGANDFRTPATLRGDPIVLLPEPARAKLRALRAANEDALAALHGISDRLTSARLRLQTAEARLRTVTAETARLPRRNADQAGSGWIDDRHGAVKAAEADRDRIKGELDDLNLRYQRLTTARSPLPDRIADWLRAQGAAVRFDLVPAVEPKAKSSTLAAVEAAREERLQHLADLKAVRDAPIPVAMAKAAMTRQIDELAQRGAPVLHQTAEKGLPVNFRSRPVHSIVLGDHQVVQTGGGFDALAFACWLHRDEMVARLAAELDALADDGAALTDVERGKREAEILARLDETERREEALIELAERRGAPVRRRDDADPAAVLGVRAVRG